MHLKSYKEISLILSIILFVGLFFVGLRMASKKPLWNDEKYSLNQCIINMSYIDMISGKVKEGNNCPFFYFSQKVLLNVFNYKLPKEFVSQIEEGRYSESFYDLKTQILTRISPVLFMSLSIVLIFYYFSSTYGVLIGAYALIITLSTYIFWYFYAEARPYSLWIFFTTLQSIFILKIISEKNVINKLWVYLSITHIFMSFTILFSILQVACASIVLWIYKERKIRYYVFLTIVPWIISLFYYFKAPKYKFWFADSPLDLISASYSKERMFILFIYLIVGLIIFINRRINKSKSKDTNLEIYNMKYVIFVIGMMITAVALVVKLKLGFDGKEGAFQVSNRYFVYLAPISIFATTLFTIDILAIFKTHKFVKYTILFMILAVVIIRFVKSFLSINGMF